ncbi:VOC family protein [Phycicoccus sp.]|uniref:VOC family protein n=1 Tax=Phycicoccus sp. TaxID=1902410 RepID=UPI002BDCF62B|nr:VOC family protein [Phycicoccus sp.]HMM93791.1 VOC family protein [Phycicoccus sp.]
MLGDHTPVPTLAVKDLARAREFYEGVLGLVPDGEPPEGVMYRTGSSRLFVYPSAFAGTNKATAVSFQVRAEAFAAEVEALRAGGIEFQTFEAPGLTWSDGVASMGDGLLSAWFADPDGNILNLETAG